MSIFDIFSSSGGEDAATAANAARTGGLRKGFNEALKYYDQGLQGATTQYERAAAPFEDFINTGLAGNTAYANATGLNGQEGYDQAVQDFHTAPGYQFSVDQATEAAKRNASSLGRLGSGNTLTAISDRAQGLADQQFQQYLDNLYRESQSGQTAAQGQASVLTGLANATNQAGINKGNLAYGTETGVGNSQAQMEADKYAAQQSASKNIWDAVFNVAKLGTSIIGGAPTSGATTTGWAPTVSYA